MSKTLKEVSIAEVEKALADALGTLLDRPVAIKLQSLEFEGPTRLSEALGGPQWSAQVKLTVRDDQISPTAKEHLS